MNKYHFVLIVEYLSGKCAFPTDTDDLQRALREFEEEYRKSFSLSTLEDKTFTLPTILSAQIVKMYYRK